MTQARLALARQPIRSGYRELVKSFDPTYYWSMQEPVRSAATNNVWAPDAGPYMFAQSTSLGAGPAVSAPWDGELAHRGGSFECGTDGASSAGVVNANRNTTGYSYMVWARLNATGRNDDAIMGNWNTSGSMLYLVSVNQFRVYHNGSFSTIATITQDTAWHPWIVTWDGTTQKTYRDGVEVNSVARAGALGSAVRLSVGYYNYTASTASDPDACHFAWWENRALTAGEVAVLSRV